MAFTTDARLVNTTGYPGTIKSTPLSTVLNTIFNQKIEKINNISTNVSGVVTLNLYDLANVNPAVSGATNGQMLSFNSTSSKWENSTLVIPQTISITSGTLAARPVTPTVTSVYIIDGDPVNNGRTFIYNMLSGTPSWMEVLPKYTFDDLTNVSVSGAITGDSIVFNGSQWVPQASGLNTLDWLNDVSTSGAVIGNTIMFNGTSWVASGTAAPSLATLSDTSGVSSAAYGDILSFDGSKWIPTRSDLNNTLDELYDVIVSGAVTNDLLTFNGTNWVPAASGVPLLANLPDTSGVSSASAGDILYFNGTKWIPSATDLNHTLDELLDVVVSGAVTNDLLTFNGTNWVPAASGIAALSTLSDTSGVSSASVGDILYFNGTKWIPSSNDLNHTLDELIDVIVSGAVTNDLLTFNGTNWVPGNVTVPSTLDDLSNVVVSGVTVGNTIVFDGTNWVPIVSGLSSLPAISFDSLSDVVVSGATAGDLVIFNGIDWVPITSGTFSTSSLSFDNLSDVAVSGVTAGDTVIFDGTNWVPAASGTSYLSTLLDVDVITVPPSSGSSLVYNTITNKWETNLNSITQSSISFTSTNPPAFSSVVPGTVWVDDTTLDQYIYIQDSNGADLWVSLGSSGASYLSTLLDVNVSGNTTNSSLVFDGSTWVPKILTTSSPVVSGTDSGRAPILDFSGKLDNSTLPTSVTKSVNGNNPDSLGNVTVSLATVLTGTLATRPSSSLNGDVYIVSGDTAANNGRTFIYKSSNTTWFEINSLGGVSTTELKVVAPGGSNITGVGTFSSPWQTIQFAINQINFGIAANIIILPGTYTENLTVSTHLNLTIAGLKGAEGSYPVVINGSITTSGTSTRLRVMDLTIAGTVSNPIPYQDTGSTGRHVFESVQFIPYTTSNAVQFSGTSKNFFGFYDCTFGGTGAVNMGSGTPSAGAQAFFTRPNTLYSLSIPNLWSAGIAVTDAEVLGITSHVASPLLIQDTRQIIALTSTATTANGALWIDQSSMYVKSTNTYTVVNKTGDCNYRFRNFEMARAGNTINGTEINTTNRTDWTRLKELYDVDLITTAPVADNVLKYDAVNAKWVPGVGGGGGGDYTYSLTAPAFTGLNAGHIWVKSDTMQQYIYVIDDALNNVWVALGTNSFPAVINSNRNKLYNGNFFVNQRVQAATLNVAGNIFPADRWIAYGNIASKFTVGRNLNSITSPPGFSSYVGFQTPATPYNPLTTDIFQMAQGIEGVDLSGFNFGTANAKTIVLSFWYRASIAGIYNFALRNTPQTHTYVGEFTITTANQWQYITVIIPGCTLGTWSTASGSAGAYLTFDLGSGSQYNTATPNSWIANAQATKTAAAVRMISNANATVYITGVQLEIGTTATVYEDIGFFAELSRCKRFFQKSYPYNTALSTNTGDGRRWGIALGIYIYDTIYFEMEMAFLPGLTLMSTVNAFNTYYDNNAAGTKAILYGDKSTKFFNVNAGSASANTAYYFNWWATADI